MDNYSAFGQVSSFNLDHYIAFMGWLGAKPIKIYTNQTFDRFYLHDEITDRFFEFQADKARLTNCGEYDKVIEAYRRLI